MDYSSVQCELELIKIVEIAKNLDGQIQILKAILGLTYAVIGLITIIKIIVAIDTSIKRQIRSSQQQKKRVPIKYPKKIDKNDCL